MNPEGLLALYERVADAPGAIPRLRRFVLDLAVRGKPVAQDPNDEPASALLKRIAAEKARLVKLGEFREPRNAVEINRDDLPFVLPSHWVWAILIDIARPSYGFAFESSHFNGEKRGMKRLFGFEQDLERLLQRPVDLIERGALGRSRNYIRRRSILRGRFRAYSAAQPGVSPNISKRDRPCGNPDPRPKEG